VARGRARVAALRARHRAAREPGGRENIYVANQRVPRAGKYWLLAEPVGGYAIQGVGLNPGLGVNRWVREWKLPSEPWIFLVGADGRMKAKFEGAVSARELEADVRRFLTQRRQ
jgi:hypothetical protein